MIGEGIVLLDDFKTGQNGTFSGANFHAVANRRGQCSGVDVSGSSLDFIVR